MHPRAAQHKCGLCVRSSLWQPSSTSRGLPPRRPPHNSIHTCQHQTHSLTVTSTPRLAHPTHPQQVEPAPTSQNAAQSAPRRARPTPHPSSRRPTPPASAARPCTRLRLRLHRRAAPRRLRPGLKVLGRAIHELQRLSLHAVCQNGLDLRLCAQLARRCLCLRVAARCRGKGRGSMSAGVR